MVKKFGFGTKLRSFFTSKHCFVGLVLFESKKYQKARGISISPVPLETTMGFAP
jgi:hypothetical protein